jgi:DNA-binding NarL/FixJ family response regulator
MHARKRRPLALPAPTILIVDDDELVATAWQRWFRSKYLAYPVVHAKNLAAARAALAEAPTLTIVLDVGLGMENGLDLLREMRSAGDHTSVLIVTGHLDLRLTKEAAALDAAITFKPIDQDEVIRFVDHAVAIPRTRGLAAMLLAMEAQLTTTQAEVFVASLDQPSNELVAEALGTTAKNVKNHVQAIMDAFGVTSRVELHQLVLARTCPARPAR